MTAKHPKSSGIAISQEEKSYPRIDEVAISVPENTPQLSKHTQEEKVIIQKLAQRSYHLAGNSWWKDWLQWFSNCHPLLGICCHHRLHPIGIEDRIISLIGSVAFGLAATSYVVIWFYEEGRDIDAVAMRVSYSGDVWIITEGMVVLWTFGGLSHSLFDLGIWYISACPCCLPGGCLSIFKKCRWFGSVVAFVIVIGSIALAGFVLALRSGMKDNNFSEEVVDNDVDLNAVVKDTLDDIKVTFSFICAYLIELPLAWFVYNPMIGMIFFSGVFGCNGRLPFLGGRAREMRKDDEYDHDESVDTEEV